MLFIEYPKCTTCRKARKWLEEHKLEFEARHIQETPPKLSELKKWNKLSGLPLRKFFNTCGQKYRELNLKDRLGDMSEKQQYDLLASDGMIVKRPILVTEDKVLVGFKESEWEETLLGK
ncbi:MAG: arsenate reductase family protein [Planctomycetia bacterium]|nr:arsenate reductase family protein [Planctomycetia bacterium]